MDSLIPAALAEAFDGRRVEAKLGLSALLSTVDGDGWPHVSFLAAGDLLLLPPDGVRLILWPQATTVANLDHMRRGILFGVADGAVRELRFAVTAIDAAEGRGTIVNGRIAAARTHRAPYAEVDSLAGFRLHDPAGVADRWRGQVAAMLAIKSSDD